MLNVLIALGLGTLGLLGVVYLAQDRMVYFPQTARTLDPSPQSYGLSFESLTLKTEDGESIHGWWVPASEAQGVVLFLHGNAGTIAARLAYVRMFHRMAYSALMIDYRGYGRSSGTPSETGTYSDALAAWKHLRESLGIPAGRIAVFGESLGGGVATWLAAREHPGALILLSTFTSIPDLGAELYPFLPVRWLSRIHYDSLARIKAGMPTPLLVAHSPGDEIVPYAHGKRLYAAAAGPKQFLELEGAHNEASLHSRRAWEEALSSFLRQHLVGDP